jgi:hypothetical protein
VGEMEDQMNPSWGMFPHRESKQQSGSAIIEVIAALVILALVSLPLIKLFTYDSIFVSYAKHDLTAVNRAQDVMEEIKALPNSLKGLALAGDSGSITLNAEENAGGIEYLSQGYMVALTGGLGAGQIRKIENYDNSSGTVFVSPDWVTPPADMETTYLLLRDRPYWDNLEITAVDSSTADLETITVTVVEQEEGNEGNTEQVSLTAEKCWW